MIEQAAEERDQMRGERNKALQRVEALEQKLADEHAEVVRLREYGAERSPTELKERNAALLLKVEELTRALATETEEPVGEEEFQEPPVDLYHELPNNGNGPEPQPERVTITDEMVEAAARTLWTMRTESAEDLWGHEEVGGAERAMYCTEARLTLTAALGPHQPESPSSSTEGAALVKLQALVDRQAEDKRLWRDGLIADALHLQLELRRLHDAVNLATESAATTPPDGGLLLDDDGPILLAVREAVASELEACEYRDSDGDPLFADGCEFIANAISDAVKKELHRDAVTDQSPETDPSPSQGEGGGQ